MLLKRILLESLNDIYIVTRCPLPRWQRSQDSTHTELDHGQAR
jgi:hypothetical protein